MFAGAFVTSIPCQVQQRETLTKVGPSTRHPCHATSLPVKVDMFSSVAPLCHSQGTCSHPRLARRRVQHRRRGAAAAGRPGGVPAARDGSGAQAHGNPHCSSMGRRFGVSAFSASPCMLTLPNPDFPTISPRVRLPFLMNAALLNLLDPNPALMRNPNPKPCSGVPDHRGGGRRVTGGGAPRGQGVPDHLPGAILAASRPKRYSVMFARRPQCKRIT